LSEPVASFLSELFGAHPALLQSLTFFKSSEQSLHQDFSYVNSHARISELAAAWIPLEDIHPDSGPLIYYPGSHFPDRAGFFDWGEGSVTETIQLSSVFLLVTINICVALFLMVNLSLPFICPGVVIF
jgi:hypothetical protein